MKCIYLLAMYKCMVVRSLEYHRIACMFLDLCRIAKTSFCLCILLRANDSSLPLHGRETVFLRTYSARCMQKTCGPTAFPFWKMRHFCRCNGGREGNALLVRGFSSFLGFEFKRTQTQSFINFHQLISFSHMPFYFDPFNPSFHSSQLPCLASSVLWFYWFWILLCPFESRRVESCRDTNFYNVRSKAWKASEGL